MRYTIGALARAADVGVETIRFYQRRKLLEEPPRPVGGIRRYGPQHAARLRFIRSAQQLGFSLEEVAGLLSLDDGRSCREAERVGSARLADVRERLVQLRRIESVLAGLVSRCNNRRGRARCPLIAALESPAA